ncbi:hypothetical protein DFH08DRAFT_906422 [Mycena albidolilacea]|uniref:Uncharacterized protein n=1 Tax=Mycena albidolilacea TaxID=1033008 RepID=A0AAD6YZ90_9AGAR|nr:hypothetical protein DFH08DRAFT_906422 [Mycena albidolilacea]
MRRYGNGLQFQAYRERRFRTLFFTSTAPRFLLISLMSGPLALESATPTVPRSTRMNTRKPRPSTKSIMRRATWHQQPYTTMKCARRTHHPFGTYVRRSRFINRKIAHGNSKSKQAPETLRRRPLRRGLSSRRTARTPSTQYNPDAMGTQQPESAAALPITLPQLPNLFLACLYPDTDSGNCSDTSRTPSCSPPHVDGPERPTRRYIRPDPWAAAASPSDFGFSSDFRVRISAHPVAV